MEWRKVRDYLEHSIENAATTTFSSLVRHFVDQVQKRISEQDYAGIIQKVAFGNKAGLYAETFLDELKRGENGGWKYWDTPHKYEKLDGTGRKLMLYDRTRRAIVAEGEIRKVEKTSHSRDFPWTNHFATGTLQVYGESEWIPLDHIFTVPGYENFVTSWSGHWNVTHEQYKQLRTFVSR